MWKKIVLQLHKSSSTTVSNSYTPSEEEKAALALQNKYTEAVMPNALNLNDSAANLYFKSLADTPVDYASELNSALSQNKLANQGYANLTNGVLPTEYLQNMQNALQSGTTNLVGSKLNDLAGKGVINSSVLNTGLNDITKNVSDTLAQSYQSSIDQLSNIYGNMANNAGNGITLGAAGQEAAVAPAQTAWNMSLGLGNSGNSTLSALAGKGTSTQTTTQSGGSSGLLSGLFGVGSSLIAACFTGETKITMADGTEKNISDICIGDEVKTYDADKAEITTSIVDSVAKPTTQIVYSVVCTDAKNKKKSVRTTLSQPLLKDSGEFIDVELMKLGTLLKDIGEVTEIKKIGERKVYDIKVRYTNTYYANGFIAYGEF